MTNIVYRVHIDVLSATTGHLRYYRISPYSNYLSIPISEEELLLMKLKYTNCTIISDCEPWVVWCRDSFFKSNNDIDREVLNLLIKSRNVLQN